MKSKHKECAGRYELRQRLIRSPKISIEWPWAITRNIYVNFTLTKWPYFVAVIQIFPRNMISFFKSRSKVNYFWFWLLFISSLKNSCRALVRSRLIRVILNRVQALVTSFAVANSLYVRSLWFFFRSTVVPPRNTRLVAVESVNTDSRCYIACTGNSLRGSVQLYLP